MALALLALAAPAAAQTSAAPSARVVDTLAHLFTPPPLAQSITIPNTFVNGTVADATQVNANFTALSSNALNRNGGTMLGTENTRALAPTADATYDVGTNVLRYRDGWFSRNGSFGGTFAVTGAATFGSTVSLNSLVYTFPASQSASAYLKTDGSGGLSWGAVATPRGCDIRLTLTTGVPVTTADVTGAATIYATPYAGSGGGPAYCAFYDGSATWSAVAITEVPIALGTITSALPYDVFCYSNAGVFACDAPVAWTNTATRATALTTQNGVYVKTGATTRRYIGTFVTTSTTTTEDSLAKRLVWNYYNRQRRPMRVIDTTDSWPYTPAATTWRQARASAANQLELVVGVAEGGVDVSLQVAAANSLASCILYAGLAEDATTAPDGTTAIGAVAAPVAAYVVILRAALAKSPAAGRHFYAWLETTTGTCGTMTVYGDDGSSLLKSSMLWGWTEG